MVGKMDPEEYGKMLECINLENIFLKDLRTKIDHDLFSENMSVSINSDSTYSLTNSGFIVNDTYKIVLKNDEKKNALSINCTYCLVFSSKKQITDEFFEIYKEINLPLSVWPYVRELANSLTSRMYIPPLTLPLYKR